LQVIPAAAYRWVELNLAALLDFWQNGSGWYADEVERFRRSLRRV
jgi:hypothetical protein